MSSARQVRDKAKDDMVTWLADSGISGLDISTCNPWDHIAPQPSSYVFDDIARDDPTYQSISDTLIRHSKIPGLYLLKYQTMHGARAYQPCSKDIDIMGFFKPLDALHQNGDPLFKDAREWSCIMQAMERLPRDIR